MIKRILAWILLAGFLLIIINILFIGWYRETSAYIYLVVAITFFFYSLTGKKRKHTGMEETMEETPKDDEDSIGN